MRCLALVVLLTPCAWSQTVAPEFVRVDAALPHNTVYDLLQDQRGFLWAATADGLARFDGRRTRTYLRRPGQADALASNTVQALAETPGGTLWVGTSAGVCRLSHEARGWFSCPPPALDVLHLAVAEGTVWAVTVEDVWRFDGASFRRTYARTRPGWRTVHRVVDGRLVRFVSPPGSSRVERFLYDPRAGRFVSDGEERLTEGAAGVIDEAGRLRPLPSSSDLARRVRDDFGLLAMFQVEAYGAGRWVGTEAGLFDWEGEALREAVLREGSVLSDGVLALVVDVSGAVWAGTRSGLFVHDPSRSKFSHVDPAESEGATPVMAVETDPEGALWVGTLGGLLRQPSGGAMARVPFASDDDVVWDVHAAGGAVWVATDDGLCRLSGSDRACWSDPFERRDGRSHVYAVEDDGRGGLWAAGSVLVRLAADGRELRHVPFDAISGGGAATVLFLDRRKRLWVGGENRGLWRIDTPDAPLWRVAPTLATETVWSIHEDRGGALWLGTSGGLVHFDPGSEQAQAQAADLPGSTVYGVVPDGDDLWLTTNRGLARYRPTTGALRVFGPEDGVRITEFNRRAVHRAPDGRLWAGGMAGLTGFDPSALDEEVPAPRPVVVQVRAEGAFGESVYEPDDVPRLGPDVQTVTLDVAAPLPSGGRSLRYAYRLDGGTWTEIEGEPSVRFAGLSPGRYLFGVRAARGDGAWGEPAHLAFSLAPPWYGSAWFRLLAALAVASGVALAWRAHVGRVRREERMRWRIASDLHDDIGSGLSSVALLTEHVRDRADLAAPEARQLTAVAHAARSMIDSLREIVWFVDPAHDRPGAFATRARETAVSLVGPGVTLDVPASNRVDAAPLAWRRDLFLILKEALHNAVRHAPGAAVTVRLAESGGHVELEVRDDGPGFVHDAVAGGTGLRSLRHRAEALNGTLTVESAPARGTVVALRAPLP